MTDNEIIKALEYWREFDKEIDVLLKTCPKAKADLLEQREIVKITLDALDLINRQRAEIERLEKNLETETNHITRLENQIERLLQRLETAKAEAHKGFAERYRTLLETELHWCECADEIIKPLDNLLKEKVGAEE